MTSIDLLTSFYELIGLSPDEAMVEAKQFIDLCCVESIKLGIEQINDKSKIEEVRRLITEQKFTNIQAVQFIKDNLSIDDYKIILMSVISKRMTALVQSLKIELSQDQIKKFQAKLAAIND